MAPPRPRHRRRKTTDWPGLGAAGCRRRPRRRLPAHDGGAGWCLRRILAAAQRVGGARDGVDRGRHKAGRARLGRACGRDRVALGIGSMGAPAAASPSRASGRSEPPDTAVRRAWCRADRRPRRAETRQRHGVAGSRDNVVGDEQMSGSPASAVTSAGRRARARTSSFVSSPIGNRARRAAPA
jgi:hypothetical protein